MRVFKGGHSKKLTFLSSTKARKHSAFPLIEVSASDMLAILKKFVSKKATSEVASWKLSRKPGCVYVTSFRPTWKSREGEKPATDFASFTGSAKSKFSKRLSTSLSSMLTFRTLKHVWLKIIWLKSSYNPEWLFKKGLSEAIWTNCLGRNDVTKTRPGCEYFCKRRQRCRFVGLFEKEFHTGNFAERLNLVQDCY